MEQASLLRHKLSVQKKKCVLKRMGVMNITPNSFSDGNQLETPEAFLARLQQFGSVDCIDIGAESTAPMNASLSWQEEWARWQMILPLLPQIPLTISADTYHPETIFELVSFWKNEKINVPLIWNDVSGKFDDAVRDFLKEGHCYVLCHNRAPARDLSGRHMEYVQAEADIKEELKSFFSPYVHERVIFDPCLGFSKTYEENWWILENFPELQESLNHNKWLLGFSRKSFLRKKYNLEISEREKLDLVHEEVLAPVLKKAASGTLWVRTHRPELLRV